MIVNGKALLDATPIVDMWPNKQVEHGVSFGLGEAGYDIRIKQTVRFQKCEETSRAFVSVDGDLIGNWGKFTLASAMD